MHELYHLRGNEALFAKQVWPGLLFVEECNEDDNEGIDADDVFSRGI